MRVFDQWEWEVVQQVRFVPIRTVQAHDPGSEGAWRARTSGEKVGRTRDARPVPCEGRTCETDPDVREPRIGRACRRLRMSLSGLWLHHGLRGGCAARKPEAVTGATHLFRCPVWHLGGLGCALHPNLRGGSLRASNPMREGQTASRNGRVPALAADAGQPDGQVVGQRVLQRLGAALDTLPGRTVGWE